MRYLFMHENDASANLSSDERNACLEYINSSDDIYEVSLGGIKYLIDKRTLDNKVCFDVGCLSCMKCHGNDCCFGVPYSCDEKVFDNIEKIFDKIVEKDYFDKSKMNFIKRYGWMSLMGDAQEGYNLFDTDGLAKTIRNDGNYCVFHVNKDGLSCCSIHKYCLENNLNPYEYKPTSCFLYPLDAIEIRKNKIFIFGLDKSNLDFCRWTEDFYNYACINKNITDSSKKISKYFHNYKSIYLEQEMLIRHLFSDELFGCISDVMNGDVE